MTRHVLRLTFLMLAAVAGLAASRSALRAGADSPDSGCQANEICHEMRGLVTDIAGTERAEPDDTPANTQPRSEPSPTPPATLTWGYDATPEAATWTRPPRFQVVADPAYDTPVQRLTNSDAGRWDRNDYSRRQAESHDGSRFLSHVRNFDNVETFRVYEMNGTIVNDLNMNADGEPQWHPSDSNLIRHIAGPNANRGDLTLLELNVDTNQSRVIADLGSRLRSVWPDASYMRDREEGSPSADGNRYAWIVYDGSENPLGIVSYDLSTDQILGTVAVDPSAGFLDAVTATPTGSYVVAHYGNGTFVFDADMSNRRTINLKGDHSDVALNADGGDSYVYIDYSSGPDAGFLVSVDLDTLERTRIFEVYGGTTTSMHISGKGYDKPGWVIVSTYNCKQPGGWACDKVFAAEMQPNGRILNLAHTYNCDEDDYYTEAHGVVSRDFTHVYVNSDSALCGRGAEIYRIDIPTFD